MLSKGPFCQQRYTHAAAYVKHLRTTHANGNIIFASTTIRYPSLASDIVDTQTDVVGECLDADYDSNPEPTGQAHDVLSVMLCTSLILKCLLTLLLGASFGVRYSDS